MKPLGVGYLVESATGGAALCLERHRAELQAVKHRDAVIHEVFKHPPITDAQLQRAVEIADQAMWTVITTHCTKGDEHGVLWGLPSEGDPGAVTPELFEALTWMGDRGLIEMTDDTVILLVGREPGKGL